MNKDHILRAEVDTKERDTLLSSFHHHALLLTGFIRIGGEAILGIIPEKRQQLYEEVGYIPPCLYAQWSYSLHEGGDQSR